LYCCPNEAVLLEVAHMVYGMGLSFAIIVRNKYDGSLQYKWSSFADKTNPKESAVLYLADIFVTRILLEERAACISQKKSYLEMNRLDPISHPLTERRIPSVPDYILIADEPTKGADSQTGFMVDSGFSLETELFIDILRLAPPRTILMSATLPTYDQIPHIYNSLSDRYNGIKIRSFASSESKIGCALTTANGKIYVPHYGCTTVDSVKKILEKISTNPFLGRFYTFGVLLEMVKIFDQAKLPTPDLSILFSDPTKANQATIQQTVYQMLETVIQTGSDSLVTDICNKLPSNPSRIDKILTKNYNKFNRGCLVFSSNPVATAFETYHSNFDSYLQTGTDGDTSKLKIKSEPEKSRNIFQQVRMDSILTRYQTELEHWQKSYDRLNSKESGKKTEAKKMELIDSKPKWNFPPELQLGTLEHYDKSGLTDFSELTNTVSPSDLPKDSSVCTEILTMLASGIGIYSTESEALDSAYLQSVLYLAKKGTVKIIFTDSSIAYGTNLAVSDIIIVDEPVSSTDGSVSESITDKHSVKTIFQMLGRAGRGGHLSYQARIYTTSKQDHLVYKIQAYALEKLDEGSKDEVQNIQKAWNILN